MTQPPPPQVFNIINTLGSQRRGRGGGTRRPRSQKRPTTTRHSGTKEKIRLPVRRNSVRDKIWAFEQHARPRKVTMRIDWGLADSARARRRMMKTDQAPHWDRMTQYRTALLEASPEWATMRDRLKTTPVLRGQMKMQRASDLV